MKTTENNDPLLTMETMMADTRKITKLHHYKWRGTWNNLNYDDLESESMFWLATHYEQGFQLFSVKGYWPYHGWLKKSLDRMLYRWCQEHVVRAQSFVALSLIETAANGAAPGQLLPVGLTYSMVVEALKHKDEDMLLVAAECCTDKQYHAIKGVLFDGDKIPKVAAETGVAVSTVKFHIDRGVHNIVSKTLRR